MTALPDIAYTRVIDAFRNQGLIVDERGDRASAQAPGHSAADRSVVITKIAGQVLVHSHSDPTADVLDTLGLTPADLFDEQRGTRYEYGDGRIVHRSPDKKFRQSGNTKGRSLFHADRIADNPVVYYVEGEKDVLAVEAAGSTAVCHAQGAGKVGLVDLEPLSGKTVIVVADKDESGRRNAEQVADALAGIAADTTIVEARTGKDAADHIAAGHDLSELVVVAESKPSSGEPAPRLWRATDLAEAQRLEWLARKRIPRAAVTYMLGPEGIGKSMFMVWLIALVTTGRAFAEFGIPKRAPAVVVLVITEDDWSTVVRPRLELAGADLSMIRVFCADADGSGSPTMPGPHMDILLQSPETPALVVVDAWADTLPASLSVKDPQQARRALHPWKDYATRTGAAVLLSGHTNRVSTSNARDAYGLTGELRKKARMTLLAQPDADEEGVMLIGPEKSNVVGNVPASRFKTEAVQVFPATDDSDGTVPRLKWIGDSEQSAREYFADSADTDADDGTDRTTAEGWLREYLKDGKAIDSAVVKRDAKAADISVRTLQRARKKLGNVSVKLEGSPPRSFWKIPSVPPGPHIGKGGTDGTDDIHAGQATVPGIQESICATAEIQGRRGTDEVCTVCRGPMTLAEDAHAGRHAMCVPEIEEQSA